MKPLFSCGSILFRKENGEILYLLLDHGSFFGFPKGLKEENETDEETLKREVFEETGIKQIELKNFHKKISWKFKQNGKLVSKQAVFYLAETKEKEVRISFEHIGFEWCAFEEALKLIKFENTKEMFIEAHHVAVRS